MAIKPQGQFISFAELGSSPSTPSASNVKVFAGTDKLIKIINSSGTTISISGGATVGDDLDDVVISSPATGHYLRYNSGNWVNGALQTIPATLSDLSDVDTTGVSVDETLMKIGSNYLPKKNQPALAVIYTGSSFIGAAVADDTDPLTSQMTRRSNSRRSSLATSLIR